MNRGLVFGAVVSMGVAVGASAQPSFHTGTSVIGSPDGQAVFCCLNTGDSLSHYQEDGLDVHINHTHFSWSPCGMTPQMYYLNGGAFELVVITQIDGSDFGALEVDVSNGWGSCESYVWVTAYLDGAQVGDFTADVPSGSLVGLSGGGFDEVRIGAYFDAATRDLKDPAGYNAIAIDNATYGGGGVSLVYSGPCPGPVSASVSGATAGGTVGLVFASCPGNFTIGSGVCAGTQLGLCSTNLQLVQTGTADASGNITFSGPAPAVACGAYIQAVDVTTCGTSNVEQLN